MSKTSTIQLGLLVLCAIICAVLLRLPYALPHPEIPAAAPADALTFEDQSSNTDLTQFTSTHNRPLFSKTRTPVATNKAQAGPTEDSEIGEIDDIEFKGTMEVEGERRVLLVSQDDAAGSWLLEGETYQGWTIGQIRNEEILLQSIDGIVRLPLYNQGPTR